MGSLFGSLGNNKLGAEGGKATAGAPKVNTSITNIKWPSGSSSLYARLDPEGGKAIAEALKGNTSITNIK